MISFRTSNGKVQAVRGIDFDLMKGETLAIVGESGSGKSVTSKAILGILAANALIEGGEIIYDGQDLLKISETERKIIRRWLDFYEKHLPTFRHGHWQAVYHQSNVAYITVSHDGESIVFLLDPARLEQALTQAEKRVVVLNLSLEELHCANAESANGEGNPGPKGVIPPGGSGCVDR